MTRSTRWFLILLAVTTALSVAFVAVAYLTRAEPTRRAGSVLVLDLEGEIPEDDPHAALNTLLGQPTVTLSDLVQAIDAAADDDRIAAIHLRVGVLGTGWAKAREIRDALLRFREGGKPIHAYIEFGDDGTYYVASAADDLRMMETGTLWLDGISAEVTFYAGTLEKIGVAADLEQVGEYKNAADVMVRRDMSEAHREAMNGLVEGLYGELVSQLSDSLDRTEEEVRDLISQGPYTAREALESGLLDGLAYEDEAHVALDEALGRSDVPRLSLRAYLETRRRVKGRRTIAVVRCVGTILPGRSHDGVLGGRAMGSETIAEAIRQASEDDDAAAIVLRVDSPGGSPVASDAIWRAAERAREQGIPVVVSMSDVAASGGYWISMGADRVFAQPSTITGSIGIYGGKYVLEGLNRWAGMTSETIERGSNAGFNSVQRRYTPPQRAWLRHELESVYRLFLERTAAGRGFPTPEDVDKIARGRVWTGRQAAELGLVDELGGLREAVQAARELADVPEREAVTLQTYPRAPGLWEALFDKGARASVLADVRAELAGQVLREVPVETMHLAALRMVAEQLRKEGVLAYLPYRVIAN